MTDPSELEPVTNAMPCDELSRGEWTCRELRRAGLGLLGLRLRFQQALEDVTDLIGVDHEPVRFRSWRLLRALLSCSHVQGYTPRVTSPKEARGRIRLVEKSPTGFEPARP